MDKFDKRIEIDQDKDSKMDALMDNNNGLNVLQLQVKWLNVLQVNWLIGLQFAQILESIGAEDTHWCQGVDVSDDKSMRMHDLKSWMKVNNLKGWWNINDNLSQVHVF